jgi:hypothetical protein
MSIKLSSEKVKIGENEIFGSFFEMENAVIVFIWEGPKPRLGTTSITLPDGTSSQVIGERDIMISKVIGERLAQRFGKLALISTNLPKDFKIDPKLIILLDKLSGEENV